MGCYVNHKTTYANKPAAMTYRQKLLDPRWQKKRLLVLERAGWQCESCGDEKSTLHVHHKQYIKGREPWEYDENQLAALCECCHEATHETPDALLDVISRLNIDGSMSRDYAAHILAGWLGLDKPGEPSDSVIPVAYYEAGQLIQAFVNQRFNELQSQKVD
jgi:hypothetical protein